MSMTRLQQKIAFNDDGVLIVNGTSEVTAEDAGCAHFRAVKAVGGTLVIASFDAQAEIYMLDGTDLVSATNVTLTAGDILLGKFRAITLTSGSAALTRYKL